MDASFFVVRKAQNNQQKWLSRWNTWLLISRNFPFWKKKKTVKQQLLHTTSLFGKELEPYEEFCSVFEQFEKTENEERASMTV